MLDIRLLREDPERVKADLARRGRDTTIVDDLVSWDERWRQGRGEIDHANRMRNEASRLFGPMAQCVAGFGKAYREMVEASAAMKPFQVAWQKPAGLVASLLEKPRRRKFGMGLERYATQYQELAPLAIRYLEVLPAWNEWQRSHWGTVPPVDDSGLRSAIDRLVVKTLLAGDLAACGKALQGARMAHQEVSRLMEHALQSSLWPADEVDLANRALTELHKEPSAISAEVANHAKRVQAAIRDAEARRNAIHRSLPNLMARDVPSGRSSADNVEVRRWGKASMHDFPAVSHVDLLESLDVADLERAARAAGARFFYLKRDLVLLGRALEFFALERLAARGYTPIEPPYMLRREAIEGAVDLADFEDVIYRVEAGAGADADAGDAPELFLIATSEHALAALHMGEILDTGELPLRYAGVSPCFRKEAGAHGKDTKGIFRVHQFSKVEQFVYAPAEQSWDIHEELVANAEALYQELGIPYRVVNICTGDLGTVAAKKYDIEAWMPVQGAYREVVSASHCTDYQARRYNTRHRPNPGDETQFVHTLNATAIAVQRTLVAILENFQQEDGSVAIPEPLRPFVGQRDRIEPVA